MTLCFVDYRTAIARKNPYADWLEAQDRLRPEAWPHVQPSFSLDPGDTILTIGSCFARNIESHLAKNGFRVPSLSLGIFGEASLLNKYTPPSISQEICWAARIYRRDDKIVEDDISQYMYRLRNGAIIDNNLAGFQPVSPDTFFARRERIYQIFREAFTAKCIVLTPGLAEAWFDAERNIFIQQLLTGHHADISRNLKFTMLDFETCFNCLDQTVSVIRDLNPKAKFLITTSPIPLRHTFSGQDILIANTYAKSVLRAACGDLATKWDEVDYFPSFETVTLTDKSDIFAADNLHLNLKFTSKIMDRVIDIYSKNTKIGSDHADLKQLQLRFQEAISSSNFEEASGLLGRLDEAIDSYVKSGDTSLPHFLEPDAKLANYLLYHSRVGDAERELAVLFEIAKLRPDNASVQFRIANSLWRAGRFADSEPYFVKTLELKSYDPLDAGISLATVWIHLGKPRKAIELLREMAEEWNEDARIWILLGNASLQISDAQEAERAFGRAVEIDPNNEPARYNLEQLRSRRAG